VLAHDLLPLGAPDLRPARDAVALPRGPGTALLHYDLRVRIPAGADDECFIAVRTTSQWEVPLFVRRFPADRTDAPLIDELKRRAMLDVHGVENIFELGVDRAGKSGFIVSEFIRGSSLREIYIALHGRGERLPWSVAVVLAHDALVRLEALRAVGFVHPAITGPRMRISLSGGLWLCTGEPRLRPEPAWFDVVWAALRPIFALAADDHERIVLADLLAAPEPDALAVACDAITERHPEVDPLLPLALVHRAEHARLAPLVDRAAVRRLWNLLIVLATR